MDIIDIALARKNAGSGSSITSVGTDQIQDGAVTLEKLDSNVVEQMGSGGGADWNATESEDGYIANKPFDVFITTITTLYEGSIGSINYATFSSEEGYLDKEIYIVTIGESESIETIATYVEISYIGYSEEYIYIGNPKLFYRAMTEIERVSFQSPNEDTFSDNGMIFTSFFRLQSNTVTFLQYNNNEFLMDIPYIKIEHKENKYTKLPQSKIQLNGLLIRQGSGTDSELFNQANEASGDTSHAEGYDTTASGFSSHAEGYSTTASGHSSHAEGYDTTASGFSSHAEGESTIASEYRSHAEGYRTKANGHYSHAEGSDTQADGSSAHAEGDNTQAIGHGSHAEGRGTKASGNYQHVSGTYNLSNSTSLEIIGNGTSDSKRSNARTLDTNGNEWLAGGLTVNTTSGITIGSTTINETQLQNLLALLS